MLKLHKNRIWSANFFKTYKTIHHFLFLFRIKIYNFYKTDFKNFIEQKIYAKIKSSPQYVIFSQIFNFKVNLTPFEPVDLTRTLLKSFFVLGHKICQNKKNPINKIFSKLRIQIFEPKISKQRIWRTKIFWKPVKLGVNRLF